MKKAEKYRKNTRTEKVRKEKNIFKLFSLHSHSESEIK